MALPDRHRQTRLRTASISSAAAHGNESSTPVIAGTAFHQESRLGMDGMKAPYATAPQLRECAWLDRWMDGCAYVCGPGMCVCAPQGEGTGEAKQIRRILAATDLIEELVRERLQRNARQCTSNRRGTLPRDRAADEPHTAYNIQHAACSAQRTMESMQNIQHAACSMQRTTLVLGCGRRHRTGAADGTERADGNRGG